MHPSELVIQTVSFFVTSFLALSAWTHATVADVRAPIERALAHIELQLEPYFVEADRLLGRMSPHEEPAGEAAAPQEPQNPFAFLREHAGYQQAAVLGAANTEGAPRAVPTADIQDATVNILCTYRTGRISHGTAGSGVFIDPKGVILTNAHIAQFLLLANDASETDAECVVRTGSPAEPRYRAGLLYIPPVWVYENRAQLREASPSGTGRQDYALLYVSEGIEGALPESFPYLEANLEFLTAADRGRAVTLAGYPAEVLREEGIRAPLANIRGETAIVNLFAFDERKTADLISVGSTAVGEEGSSGGPVAGADGRLIALIVTRGNLEREGDRSLRAITLPYIDRTLAEETGFGLSATIGGDIARRAEVFEAAIVSFLSGVVDTEVRGR